jgi:gliding motility-associated-like protein
MFLFDPVEPEVGQTVMFTNESEGLNIHYNWSFGDGSNSTEENPTHIYNSENSDNYNVILTVSDDAGCSDMYAIPVPVVDNHVLFVPNTFTPNQDGVNDIFLPVVACVASYYIMIYDRSGSIVFASDNPEIGWDGTFGNGKPCPSGIYTYYINYIRYNNLKQELIKTGTINLIR